MKVNIGAAFVEGFRVIGREPLSLVGWALSMVAYYIVQLVIGMLVGGGMAAGIAGNMSRMGSGQFDPSMLGGFFLVYLISLIVGVIYISVLFSAIYRTVLEPEGPRAWARLRIGRTEMVFALSLFLLAIVYIVWALVTALICGLLFRSGALGGVLGVVLGLFSAFAFISLFSFVGPMTVDRKRFAFVDSVGLAASQFWRLMGLNLLLLLLLVAVYIVMVILVMIFMGGAIASMSTGDPALAQQAIMKMMLSPVTWILMLIVLPLLGTVVQVLFVTPAAKAYADASGGAASHQVETFS